MEYLGTIFRALFSIFIGVTMAAIVVNEQEKK